MTEIDLRLNAMLRLSTLVILLTAIHISALCAGNIRIDGSSHDIITETPAANTGLDNVYIMFNTQGCRITYTASSASAAVRWQKFGYLGAAHATDISDGVISRAGTEITLTEIEPDCGYAITDNGRTTYIWIVDYSRHPFDISSINFNAEQDCDRASVNVEGSAERITYYSITGRACTLSRDIEISYTTLIPDMEQMRYVTSETSQKIEYIENGFNLPVPLCNTYFSLSGDRFLKHWGLATEITSPLYTSQAVALIAKAEKVARDNQNEIRTEEQLGGSAPVEIVFSAAATDAAIFTEWQMATDPEFENITFRENTLDFSHTFYSIGTIYVRFMAANAAGRCERVSDTFTVNIGESSLQCPNAFSPEGSPGINDEWKVSYKSIISFECYIFNRWGEKMAEFHDPAQGWDGKHKGKYVSPGVYYYVIKAKGSDGKEYDLNGDINIVGYNKSH